MKNASRKSTSRAADVWTKHFWTVAATFPKEGTKAPYAVCAVNPTTSTRFTLNASEVTCKHCKRIYLKGAR